MSTKKTSAPVREDYVNQTVLAVELGRDRQGASRYKGQFPPAPADATIPVLVSVAEFMQVLDRREEITTSQLAEIANLSPRRISQLVEEGHLPEPIRHGVFRSTEATRALMIYTRVQAANR